MRIAHIAFNFCARHECGYGVDDYDIDRATSNKHFADLKRLFASVRLADQEVVDVDTAPSSCVHRVERMLDVDIGGDTANSLCRRNDMEGKRRLAGTLWSIDFDNAPSGQAPDPKCQVKSECARRNCLNLHLGGAVTQAHDRTATELLLGLTDGEVNCLQSFDGRLLRPFKRARSSRCGGGHDGGLLPACARRDLRGIHNCDGVGE